MRAVDQHEVELARLPVAEDVGRGADPEREVLGRDPATLALSQDAVGLVLATGVTASCSAPPAAKTIVLAPAPVSSVAIPGARSAR